MADRRKHLHTIRLTDQEQADLELLAGSGATADIRDWMVRQAHFALVGDRAERLDLLERAVEELAALVRER